ncbi:MAG: ribbon-helix-helix domain-containing protein [Acidimicrobiales bacterium]
MRTTVPLDSDSAAIIERVRREKGVGVSKAVNALIHQAVAAERSRTLFNQRTAHLGALMDVHSTAEVLDLLEGPTRR